MGWYRYKQYAPETLYHIYNRGVNKLPIFHLFSDYTFYLRRLQRYALKYQVDILGYCLMPNHIHLLLWQKSDTPIYKFMQALHTSYSTVFNARYERIGPLFQDRYKQKIIDSPSYLTHILRYIHSNPLEHTFPDIGRGYFSITNKKQLIEFPFSSAREYKTRIFLIICEERANALIHNLNETIDFAPNSQSLSIPINYLIDIEPDATSTCEDCPSR